MKDPYYPEIKPIEPQPVTLDSERSALLVLELSDLCADPEYFAAPLVPGITKLLDKARAAGILTVFTVPHPFKGKPHGKVFSGFQRRPSEALFFPPGFDKFAGGQLQSLLSLYDIDTLLMIGCKANMALLYTATRAVTEYHYKVVIPVDGIEASTDYEKEYSLFHFRAYPGGVTEFFTFTKLDMISFQSGL
jgi:nicotinamidase-related amidase